MPRKSSLRVSLIGLPIAALVLGAHLMGCSSEKPTISAPDVGGPMNSAFPSLGDVSTSSPQGPSGLWSAPGDVDNDGLLDVFIAHRYDNKVTVHRMIDQDNFVNGATILTNAPRDIASGDVNGDGAVDIAIHSAVGNKVTVYVNDGSGSFSQAANVTLPGTAGGIVTADFDGNAADDVFLTTSNPNVIYRIADSAGGYAVSTIDATGFGAATNLSPLANSASDCGDEPDCDVNAGPGIQECMRAVECRRDKCYWAACVLYTEHWWQAPRYAAAMLACASVAIVERTLCLPTQLIPKGSLTTSQTVSTKTDVVVSRTLDAAGDVNAEIRYFVEAGEVRVQVTTTNDGAPVSTEVFSAGAYTAPLLVGDDGTNLNLTWKSDGSPVGFTPEETRAFTAPYIQDLYPNGVSAREIGPIVIPLGRCVLVIGWSPPEYPGCLVAVLACDTNGDFKPDYCRLMIWCPGGNSSVSDCSGQIGNE
jgi:hypothetical protein